jgi:phosphatidylglycerol lysyltransferase
MELKYKLHQLTPIISLLLFVMAIFVVRHEVEVYRWHDIRQALQSFPLSLLVTCVAITLLAYVALSFYDYLALEYAGEKLPYQRVLFTSFLSYTISNNVGHAWLSGGSMRYRLYSSWGVSGVSIAKVVAFCTVTYILGALTLVLIGFGISSGHMPITNKLPNGTLQVALLLSTIFIGAWWWLVLVYRKPLTIKNFSLTVPSPSLALRQLLVALLDLSLASLVLYLPLFHFIGIPFGDFLVLYIFAQLIGLISQVPGGIGVFEGSFLFLASNQYPAQHILASLIIYRVIYYFMPLLISACMLVAYEIRLRQRRLVSVAVNVLGSAVPQIFSALLLLAGALLLFSGATPALKDRLQWMEYFIPLPIMELSHMLGSIVGVVLLLLSQAVRRRIDTAYFATITMLALGMIASLGKGLDYEEALILGLMLTAFIPTRKHFYRKSALLQLDFSRQWLVLAMMAVLGSIWLGFFSHKHVEYSSQLWWQFALNSDASRFLRSIVAIVVAIAGLIAYRLLTRTAFSLVLPTAAEIDRAEEIVRQSSDTSTYLALTGDKYLLWSDTGNSFLMFDVTSKYWVVMGDPVGVAEELEELAWQLLTLADRHNAKIAFYQVSKNHIPLYLELGLAFIKLGEEARVPLPTFSLDGSKRSGLRQAYNRMLRDNISFEVIPTSAVGAILPRLQQISNHWMDGKSAREKRFSLGFYNDDYLRRCEIAVIKKSGEIIAFANIWQLENKEEISIDLMRYEPGAPNGVMEFLMISLMLWGKQHEYHWFNLGMVPLSGLEKHPLASLWNKIGNTVFRFGHEFYNFEGLYQYKSKFDPKWQPRYLAAPNGISMASALLSVTALISGGLKGVFTK